MTAKPQYSDEWHAFFTAGLELTPQIAQRPSLDLLRAYFEARTAFWPYPYATSEWNPGNFDSLELTLPVAFQLIPTATALLLEQTQPQQIANAGWLLEQIVKTSDTTEMSALLDEQWAAVMNLLGSVVDEAAGKDAAIAREYLARWYRRRA